MNKLTFLVLSVLALAILLMAACVPPAPATAPATAAVATVAPTAAQPAETSAATAADATATPDARPVVPAPDGSRALAKLTAADRNQRFSGPAATYVKPNTIYLATIITDKGNIVAELYQDTPQSLNNFVTLAENGFYDGLTFHRVEPGFVIQGGDPVGDGSGDSGYTIPAEITHFHNKGALAWARTSDQVNPDRRSSGSQFYITLDQTSFLDGAYTVFGNVIEGMDVAEKIAAGDKIQRIEISEATTSRMPTPAPSPTPEPTATPTITPTPYAPTSQEGRPLAAIPIAERSKLYNTAPGATLDSTKTYQATIETGQGKIVVELDAKLAPITVNNFVLLANLGYFDGMPVAYNDPASYLVSGSPNKQPDSDAGYTLALEDTAVASEIVTGTVSTWAVADSAGSPVASGSQFLIWRIVVPQNPGYFNSFGKVVEGMDVVAKLTDADVITKITITEK